MGISNYKDTLMMFEGKDFHPSFLSPISSSFQKEAKEFHTVAIDIMSEEERDVQEYLKKRRFLTSLSKRSPLLAAEFASPLRQKHVSVPFEVTLGSSTQQSQSRENTMSVPNQNDMASPNPNDVSQQSSQNGMSQQSSQNQQSQNENTLSHDVAEIKRKLAPVHFLAPDGKNKNSADGKSKNLPNNKNSSKTDSTDSNVEKGSNVEKSRSNGGKILMNLGKKAAASGTSKTSSNTEKSNTEGKKPEMPKATPNKNSGLNEREYDKWDSMPYVLPEGDWDHRRILKTWIEKGPDGKMLKYIRYVKKK